MRKGRYIKAKTLHEDIFCDKCGNEVVKDRFDAFDCDIKLRKGNYDAFDGAFYGDDFVVDLCEPCATELFFKILPKSGIKPIEL